MKRKLALLIALPITLLSLASCGNNGGDPTPDEDDNLTGEGANISFFGWGSNEEQANFKQLVNYYNEHNDKDIHVTYSATDSSNYLVTLQNRAENLPDVFYMPDYAFYTWAASGRLMRLDDSTSKLSVSEDELEPIWDKAVDMYRFDRNSLTLGSGDLYGLPKDLGPYTLVYNKDLLEQCIESSGGKLSLPSATKPMTFTEFSEYCAAIQTELDKLSPDTKKYAVSSYEIMPAVYSNNSDFYKGDDKRTSNVSDPNFYNAIQFIADLNLKYKAMPSAAEQTSTNGFVRFQSGNCVFTNMGPWDMTSFWNLDFDFDVIPVAKGDGADAKSTAWVGSVAYCVSAKSRNKAASLDFIKFLSLSEESNRMNYELGQAMPNIEEMAKSDFVNNVGIDDTAKQRPANKQLFVDIVSGDNPEIGGNNRAAYFCPSSAPYDNLLDSLNDVWTGKETAQKWASHYDATFQKDLDDAYEFF